MLLVVVRKGARCHDNWGIYLTHGSIRKKILQVLDTSWSGRQMLVKDLDDVAILLFAHFFGGGKPIQFDGGRKVDDRLAPLISGI